MSDFADLIDMNRTNFIYLMNPRVKPWHYIMMINILCNAFFASNKNNKFYINY